MTWEYPIPMMQTPPKHIETPPADTHAPWVPKYKPSHGYADTWSDTMPRDDPPPPYEFVLRYVREAGDAPPAKYPCSMRGCANVNGLGCCSVGGLDFLDLVLCGSVSLLHPARPSSSCAMLIGAC